MKRSLTKNFLYKNCWIILSILCSILFFYAEFGFDIIRFTNDSWVFSDFYGGDSFKHYTGWIVYRGSPFGWPLSTAKNMGYPDGVSIAFTDSIPLFAIFFKCFSGILPETFQYFGLFLFLSFVLQAFFASLLLRQFTDERSAFLGSLLFILSPSLIHRVFCHTALTAHWLITAALYLAAGRIKGRYPSCTCRSAILSAIAILIHPYFFPMVFGIYIICELYCAAFLFREKLSIRYFGKQLMMLIFIAAVMAANGMFSTQTIDPAGGFGFFVTNLNSFFNPATSARFSSWSSLYSGRTLRNQYFDEGFAYLGMGIIVGAILSIFLFFFRKPETGRGSVSRIFKRWTPFLIIFLVWYVFALSNEIYWDDRLLLRIPLPGLITRICNIFRSGGRFVWVPVYLITAFSVITICRRFPRKGYLLIILMLCLQLYDLKPGLKAYHEFAQEEKTPFTFEADGAWLTFPQSCKKLLVFNGYSSYRMVHFLAKHNMITNMIVGAPIYQNSVGSDPSANKALLTAGSGTLTPDRIPDPEAAYLLPEGYTAENIAPEVLARFYLEEGSLSGETSLFLIPR